MDRHAEGADEKPAAEAQRGGEHRAARAAFLDPAAEHRGGKAEEENGDREDPAEIGELPVVRRGFGDADQLRHRQVEDAERVNLADAQMDAQRRRRNHPAAEPRFGDRVATVQNRQDAHICASTLIIYMPRSPMTPRFGNACGTFSPLGIFPNPPRSTRGSGELSRDLSRHLHIPVMQGRDRMA